jgi:hypothetical protein
MRILVVPKNLELGGAQIDALTMARAMTRRGHEVVVAAPPGPLEARLGEIERVDIPAPNQQTQRRRSLTWAARRVQPDVIHAFDEVQILDSDWAAWVTGKAGVAGSIMSARLPWTLPESIPVTVCMPHLAEFSRKWRTRPPLLLLPPVEMPTGHESAEDLWGDNPGIRLLVVSRLALPFKQEGLERTFEEVSRIEGCTLVVVGDGPHFAHFAKTARRADPSGSKIRFAGAMVDPDPAFRAADIVLGSGGSALRGMAHGKATIVLGRRGFALPALPETVGTLAHQGLYGVGEGTQNHPTLTELVRDENSRRRSAEAGRKLVAERYDIEVQVPVLEELMEQAAVRAPRLPETLRARARRYHYRLRSRAIRRSIPNDDRTEEEMAHEVGKRLRELALPPSAWGTGKNRK